MNGAWGVARRSRTRGLTPLACLVLLIACVVGCDRGEPAPPPALAGRTMGTTYSVKLAGLPDGVERAELQGAIDAALAGVNAKMSTYDPASELSRFNASGSTDWFPVSTETATVVATALKTGRESGGAFDATVMPLVNLWSFGPEARPDAVPTDAEIAARQALVGADKLEARTDPPGLRKSASGVSVDLSAIAKGYGVDVVAELLDRRGVRGYMVEIGGEVSTHGTRADGRGWRIGIERPLVGERAVERVVELTGESLATSGDYRNYFESGGVRYSHTIDPRTGRPIGHPLASVSVLADDCMTADAFATAVMVLGPDAGYDWLVERGVAALLIVRHGDGFAEIPTPAFAAKFGPSP